MSSKLLSKVAHRDHFDHESGMKRYVELLWGTADDEKAVAEMHELMRKLGKTVADAQADAALLNKGRDLLARVESCRGCDGKSDAIGRQIAALDEEKAEWLKVWTAKRIALQQEQDRWSRVYNGAMQAAHELTELKLSAGHILGPMAVPSVDALCLDHSRETSGNASARE